MEENDVSIVDHKIIPYFDSLNLKVLSEIQHKPTARKKQRPIFSSM